ncbi:glycosyltransferase family 4 protein [bacterium]|nr:glycosyltransferase family 4 protein [bacterium]
MTPSPAPPDAFPPRIAYLLADPGVKYLDSQKGASIHARSLVRALEQEDAEVDVYAMRKGKDKIKGYKVTQVARSGWTNWVQRRVAEGFLSRLGQGGVAPNWATALGLLAWQRDFYRGVRTGCDERRPHLIYARNSWLAWPYATLRKRYCAPLVLEVNAVCAIERQMRGEIAFARRTERIERETFRQAGLILPVTAELKEQVVSFGIDPSKIIVTPNAVDLELFHPRKSGPTDGSFTIGCVHSFKAYHGMEVLLEAAAILRDRIPKLRLRLIGGGEELDRARGEAAGLGLGGIVEFTGTVPHPEVPSLLRACDVGVAPYRGKQNLYGCPMKLYEYMALKLPIVAARWGDIPNIVEEGRNALLHEEGDAQSLAEKILEVYSHPDRAREMAEDAYEIAQAHSWRGVAQMILDWYRETRL